MEAKIISLKSVSLKPETDEEKLIVDSWYGKKVVVSPTINNVGMDHPDRYISIVFELAEKDDERI